MKVLMIVSAFPPDTVIGAIRPYMFAKYLQKTGHQVTVLRSGNISRNPDNTMLSKELGIRVYSYLGENCAAERFERGEKVEKTFRPVKSRLTFLPYSLRKPVAAVYRKLKTPIRLWQEYQAESRELKIQKAYMDKKMSDEQFDVVYATYSGLSNIYAGKYAAEKFGCKWLLDFRDPIARETIHSGLEYRLWRFFEKRAVLSADICTAVSDGVAEQIAKGTGKKVYTVYNGYDASEASGAEAKKDGSLRFVYTGVMYEDRTAEPLFAAISDLNRAGKVDLANIRFEYAGSNFEVLFNQAKQHGVESILMDHGIVGRQEAARIQTDSDIFLVLTWNTRQEQGVLTGKFYEGVRARKPILAVVTGGEPNSELLKLNEKYKYGFCYENCSEKAQYHALCNWIETAYSKKTSGEDVPNMPKAELFSDFLYENLTTGLEQKLKELSGEDNGK